jgi:predicted metal-dependent hydrolase
MLRAAAAASVAAGYARGLELIRGGRLFEAHEQLELAWRAAEPPERDFFQGLVHVAVAWYQAGRGRPLACERQLEKARRRLGPFAPRHRGLEVGALIDQVERALTRVRAGSVDLDPLLLGHVPAPDL